MCAEQPCCVDTQPMQSSSTACSNSSSTTTISAGSTYSRKKAVSMTLLYDPIQPELHPSDGATAACHFRWLHRRSSDCHWVERTHSDASDGSIGTPVAGLCHVCQALLGVYAHSMHQIGCHRLLSQKGSSCCVKVELEAALCWPQTLLEAQPHLCKQKLYRSAAISQ